MLNLYTLTGCQFQDCPVFWNNVWALPPTIIVATIFLFQVTGYAALVGVAVLIVLIIPINGIYVSNKIRDLQVSMTFFCISFINNNMNKPDQRSTNIKEFLVIIYKIILVFIL